MDRGHDSLTDSIYRFPDQVPHQVELDYVGDGLSHRQAKFTYAGGDFLEGIPAFTFREGRLGRRIEEVFEVFTALFTLPFPLLFCDPCSPFFGPLLFSLRLGQSVKTFLVKRLLRGS